MGKFRLKVVRLLQSGMGKGGTCLFFLGLDVQIYTKSHRLNRKGIRLIFLNQNADIWGCGVKPVVSTPFFVCCLPVYAGEAAEREGGIYCGNATEFGDASGSPGKSFLFFLTRQSTLESDYLEIGYNAWQSITLLVVSGALSRALENPKERMIFVSGRTDNRSRSPR